MALQEGAPPICETSFQALIHNLKEVPEIGPPDALKDFFLEARHEWT